MLASLRFNRKLTGPPDPTLYISYAVMAQAGITNKEYREHSLFGM
ncbi:hypothetical protein OUHCRE11_00030 [Enterobacter asburiae]|nr:hypothetical protein ENTKAS01_40870 [Enterobacter sp. AS-1]